MVVISKENLELQILQNVNNTNSEILVIMRYDKKIVFKCQRRGIYIPLYTTGIRVVYTFYTMHAL